MMKRTILISLAALALCGCGTQRTARSLSAPIFTPAQPVPQRPVERTSTDVLTPEWVSPPGEIAVGALDSTPDLAPEPTPVTLPFQAAFVIDRNGAVKSLTDDHGGFIGGTPSFPESETRYTSYQWGPPRSGEMLVVMLPALVAGFHSPMHGEFLSPYGPRSRRFHAGIDIRVAQGDTVRAAMEGVVRMNTSEGGYGNLITLRHPCDLETIYAHNSRNLVTVNEHVQAGQAIALGGRSGNATTEHVHFEVRSASRHFNPEKVIDFRGPTTVLRPDTLYIYNSGEELIVFNQHEAGTYFSGANSVLPPAVAATARNLTPGRSWPAASAATQQAQSVESASPAAKATPAATTATVYHTVRQGDTLYALARKYSTSVARLCQLNGIRETAILSLGQRLRVK